MATCKYCGHKNVDLPEDWDCWECERCQEDNYNWPDEEINTETKCEDCL